MAFYGSLLVITIMPCFLTNICLFIYLVRLGLFRLMTEIPKYGHLTISMHEGHANTKCKKHVDISFATQIISNRQRHMPMFDTKFIIFVSFART